MSFYRHALAHVNAGGSGFLPYHMSVKIAAQSRNELYAAAQPGKVLAYIAGNAAQGYAHGAGVAVRHYYGVFAAAADIHVGRAYAYGIFKIVYEVYPPADIPLFLKVGYMHRNGRTGDIEPGGYLALLDIRLLFYYLKYFTFPVGHGGHLSQLLFIKNNFCLIYYCEAILSRAPQ